MNIFDKRPLCLILCISLAAFVIFSYIELIFAFISLALALILLAFCFTFPKLFGKRSGLIKTGLIFLTASILFSTVYFGYYFDVGKRFENQSVKIDAQVINIDTTGTSYLNTAELKCQSIDGKLFTEYKLLCPISKNETLPFSVGNYITFEAEIKSLDSTHNRSKDGFSGIVYELKNLSITDAGDAPLEHKISKLRASVTRYIVNFSSDTYAGGFFAALFTGEGDYLSPRLKTDFRRLGISHVLALSGMHLAIISLCLERVLSALRVSKKPRLIITSLFIISYMAFTGFSASVTRSGIMLLLSFALFFLSGTHDSLTSLFVAVSLICLVEPYAIYDISLWLSAFATLGVVCAYESFSATFTARTAPRKIIKFIALSFIVSAFAIGATTHITVFSFGTISLIAPLCSLLFSFLAEIYMYLGFLLLILGKIIPPIKTLFSGFYSLICGLCEFFSDIPGIYVSTQYATVLVVAILFSLSVFLFIVLNIKNKHRALFVILTLMISTYLTAFISSELREDNISYIQLDTGDCMLIENDGAAAAIGSLGHSIYSASNLAYTLSDEKITELSSLVITNYTAGLADFLDTLYSRTKVYNLCIPYPKNSDESSALRLVSRVCEAHGVKIITYPENDLISIGAAEFACTYRQPYGEDVKFTYSVLFKDKFYTYISRGMLDFETRYYAERVLGESSAIVLGSYGQTDAAPLTFRYKLPGLSKLVVNNTYVTLDTNYLDYYQNRGAYVYILKDKVRLD